MYSLYRSWLSGEPSPLSLGVPPCRGALSLPDVVVAVGENLAPPGHPGALPGALPGGHQFAAHRAVLSANSGYFKAALGSLGALAGLEPPGACVTVTGVSPEAFAPLLAYMYTGYLDIGRDNIYAVLLATHYLHMPRALELCWDFLRAHPPTGSAPPSPPTLVKPIPGLPWRPTAGPPQPPAHPAPHMVLPTAEHSPFRAPFLTVPSATATSPPTSSPRHTAERHLQQSPPRSRSPVQERDRELPSPVDAHNDVANTTATSTAARPASTPEVARASTPTPATAPASTSATTSASGKVVIDVACCDGPVRFHRVLNSSYGSEDADENQLHHGMHVPGAAQLRRARVGRLTEGGLAAGPGTAPGAAEYTCLYCNHTFKSHYCYQKHARRHLNPLTPKQGVVASVPIDLEGDADESRAGGAGGTSGGAGTAAPPRTSATTRSPARPLDMNVQYYPCKTCGAKFPSYYFVHKHRKLCHSGEDAEAAGPKATSD